MTMASAIRQNMIQSLRSARKAPTDPPASHWFNPKGCCPSQEQIHFLGGICEQSFAVVVGEMFGLPSAHLLLPILEALIVHHVVKRVEPGREKSKVGPARLSWRQGDQTVKGQLVVVQDPESLWVAAVVIELQLVWVGLEVPVKKYPGA